MDFCRLCQAQVGTVNFIENQDFIEKVAECTNIKVEDNKNSLPRKVCATCKFNIEQFYVFLLNVRLVNKKLHYNLENCIADVKKCEKKTRSRFSCSFCKETFVEVNELEDHKQVNCLKCENSAPESEVKAEISESAEKYDCISCPQKFEFNYELQEHVKTHGSSFVCSYENCKKVCTSIYTLRTHKMKHEGNTPYLCVTCGKGFTTKNSLNCHEKTHAEVKPYTCKVCNIGFSVSSNLRTHEKKHHEGRRFYCSQCTRAFITKCSLERHELVHTGLKEFKCQTCNANFYTKKELAKHERYHQGVRLYKCDRCFKRFFEKHHLTIHMRIHTGERPYECKVDGCGKSFIESQKLSRHIKARHPPG